MEYSFSKEELLRIIFSKDEFVKCPKCDYDGLIWYDGETGLSITSGTPKDMITSEQCDECYGLGYILKENV